MLIMKIIVFATKSCPHRPHMEGWLQELDLDYQLAYVEDHEEEAERYGVGHSPCLIVDDELVFQGMPSEAEFIERLRELTEARPGATAHRYASLERIPPRGVTQQLPEPVAGQKGLCKVDATWGAIQPMHVADGVRTVGELEVIEHLRAGLRVVDARTPDEYARGTIPGAVNMPHPDVAESLDESDPTQPTVFFCNGPQCAQSPWAIGALLEAGYPEEGILYYRGGMHDWLTLGLPVVPGSQEQEAP